MLLTVHAMFTAQFPLLLSTVDLGGFLPSHSVLKTQFALAVLRRTATDVRRFFGKSLSNPSHIGLLRWVKWIMTATYHNRHVYQSRTRQYPRAFPDPRPDSAHQPEQTIAAWFSPPSSGVAMGGMDPIFGNSKFLSASACISFGSC